MNAGGKTQSRLLVVAWTVAAAVALWPLSQCGAGLLPPAPEKIRKPLNLEPRTLNLEQKQGAGALALITKAAPRQPKVMAVAGKTLTWPWMPDGFNDWSNTAFIVRSNNCLNSPRSSWPVMAVVSTNHFAFPVDPKAPSAFFTVFASNTVTHLESL